jgi:hypothetical protein
VRLCEEEFVPPQPFSVHKFLKRLCELEPEVQAQQGPAFRTMLVLGTKDADAIGPDPLQASPAPAARPAPSRPVSLAGLGAPAPVTAQAASAASGLEGWLKVFNALMSELLFLLLSQDQRRLPLIQAHFRREQERLSLSSGGLEELTRWCAAREEQPFRNGLAREDMSRILHALYVWTCEAIGPSETDQLFGQALSVAEQLPEASRYPPRRLL